MEQKKIINLMIVIVIIALLVFIIGLIIPKENNNVITVNEALNDVEINQIDESKILIIYFSRSGNTETLANFIHDRVGGDIIKLETKIPYPENYDEVLEQAQEERANNARPELKTTVDLSNYDVIFVGYPLWCYDIPMAVYSFFDSYNFEGKVVIPFMSHGTSGESGTFNRIKEYLSDAIVLNGYHTYGEEVQNAKDEVNDWLDKLGF